MEYVELNNGVVMPVLGYGTYLTPRRVTQRHVADALDAGYRLIDTAQNYGNEREVGAAVRASGLGREEVFVTSKTQTSGYRSTRAGIEDSLVAAGLGYFDLMIIHWPNADSRGTYRALEEAYRTGQLRAIGLSNFNRKQVLEIIDTADVVPAVDQIETHLYWQQWGMHDFLASHGIVHESWSPLGEGQSDMLRDPVLVRIGRTHGKSPAQVLLRFLTQNRIVSIPKSLNPEHIRENLNIFDFRLSDEELGAIRAQDAKRSQSGWPAAMSTEEHY